MGFVIGERRERSRVRKAVKPHLDRIVRNVEAAKERLDNIVEGTEKIEKELG